MARTKLETTISLLKRGWQTSLSCAQAGGVMSLSQRINLDLRPMEVLEWEDQFYKCYVARFDIEERWISLPSGSRVKAWRITKERHAAA